MIGASDWVDGQLSLRQLAISGTGVGPAMLEAFRAWQHARLLLMGYSRCEATLLVAALPQTLPLSRLANRHGTELART